MFSTPVLKIKPDGGYNYVVSTYTGYSEFNDCYEIFNTTASYHGIKKDNSTFSLYYNVKYIHSYVNPNSYCNDINFTANRLVNTDDEMCVVGDAYLVKNEFQDSINEDDIRWLYGLPDTVDTVTSRFDDMEL